MFKKVRVEIPIRINMFLANSRKCIKSEEVTGGAGLALHSNDYMEIRLSNKSIINSSNKLVLSIYCDYFKNIFNYSGEFEISSVREVTMHTGYGSTITEITALCVGINRLFNNKLTSEEIRKIIKANYCESKHNKLIKGYDSGVGALACLEGGIVYTQNINSYVKCGWDPKYKVLLYNNELKNYNKMEEYLFVEKILRPSEKKDYEKKQNIINTRFIPNILNKNYEKIGRDILEICYLGSKRAECAQYGLKKQMEIIYNVLKNGGSIAGLSSLGPLNYAVVLECQKSKLIKYLKEYYKIRNIEEYDVFLEGIEPIEAI